MQNELGVCLSAARGLRMFPADAAPALGALLLGMAQRPAELLRFAGCMMNLAEWPGFLEIRALWCREIGMPADGQWADTKQAGEGQCEPFVGCGKCESGWIRVERGGFTGMKKCECRRAAEIASGAPVAALENGQGRAASRNGLQRADARALLGGSEQ